MSQITDKKNMKNEIFVDIFEKLTVKIIDKIKEFRSFSTQMVL
jgi:hypothetical protein